MSAQWILITALVVLSSISTGAQTTARPGVDWPSFRGIGGEGVGDGVEAPATFTSANAVWKTAIPGLGHSSPIIWGQQLCLTTAISGRGDTALRTGLYGDIDSVNDDTVHEWKVICLDKKTGKQLWDRSVHSGVPQIKRHPKSTHANSTLATDGTHLAAMFGSEGLYVYDLKGTLLWKKNFGVLDSSFFADPGAQWEFASSPIIHDGLVIVQADVQKNSFLAAFDVKTGKEMWRTARADVPTWSTPGIVRVSGRDQVIVSGWKHTGGYDVRSGRETWRLNGGGDIPVPMPVFGHGLIFLTSAHGPSSPVYAIRAESSGDISLAANQTQNAGVAWSFPRDGSYMATPLLYGDRLYVVRWNGVLSVFDAKSGSRAYQERLGAGTSAFTASPVANNGRIYFTSEEGDVYVLRAGPKFEVLAVNTLDASCLASPAVSEGRIFFRTKDYVLAFGK